jgi:hypothetical protein
VSGEHDYLPLFTLKRDGNWILKDCNGVGVNSVNFSLQLFQYTDLISY